MEFNYKYISTTLPYINSSPHIGHCFEFVLADVIAEFHRKKGFVFFNVGIDEHGQKVWQKAIDSGCQNTQEYCDQLAQQWKSFCRLLHISYDNFYRTTDDSHKQNSIRFFNEIKDLFVFEKDYEGNYCVGCESFVTDKEAVDGCCPIHKLPLVHTKETNKFFDLDSINSQIRDVLVDKSKSNELRNIINDKFDLSITRQNVKWGITTEDGDVFYVWFEALLNYVFAAKYYEDRESFNRFWKNSLIICGKDNLKFQAYILQALLLANEIPQTSEILVHGNILDANGNKFSKTAGNAIDPIEQVNKYGVDAVRYYLAFGLNTTSDSKYSEEELVAKWNDEVVNGFGNLISRLLHLIELREVPIRSGSVSVAAGQRIYHRRKKIEDLFAAYELKQAGILLNETISNLNKRITVEKPFDKNCVNYVEILNEIYWELSLLSEYYGFVLKEHKEKISFALLSKKKTILFQKI